MRKICHIRCNDKYWETLNVYTRVKSNLYYNYYIKIIDLWNKYLKIDHLSFRKHIRDMMLNNIINKNYFDIILESDQHCEKYLNNNKFEDTLFFQQDDDDIFLGIPPLEEMSDGINIFNYSFIDPLGSRRKRGYKNREFGFDKPTHTIQSNHCLIYNQHTTVDLLSHKMYQADHTYYNKLIKKYTCKIFNSPISIQVYHLHSISLWKAQYNRSLQALDYTKDNNFLYFVDNYIKGLDEVYLENKKIPLFKEMYGLYKYLL